MFHNRSTFPLMLIFAMGLTACNGGGGDDGGGGGGGNSGSHNAGTECLACHDGGSGTNHGPLFTAAGTVYTSGGGAQSNATITFYVPNTNNVIASVDTDANGNFYTNNSGITTNLSMTGIDPVITGPSSGTYSMPGVAVSGACNTSGCHSGNKINAD